MPRVSGITFRPDCFRPPNAMEGGRNIGVDRIYFVHWFCIGNRIFKGDLDCIVGHPKRVKER